MSLGGIETGAFSEDVIPAVLSGNPHPATGTHAFSESPKHARDPGVDPFGTPQTLGNFGVAISPAGGLPATYLSRLPSGPLPPDSFVDTLHGSNGSIISHSGLFEEFNKSWIVGVGAGFVARSDSAYPALPLSLNIMLGGSYHFSLSYVFDFNDSDNLGKQLDLTAQIVSTAGIVADVTPAGLFIPSAANPNAPAGITMTKTGDFSSTALLGTNWFWLQLSFNGTLLNNGWAGGAVAPIDYSFNVTRTGP